MPIFVEQANDSFAEWSLACEKVHPQTGTPDYWTIVESNVVQWAKGVTVAQFWSDTGRELEKWRTEYRAQTGSTLLSQAKLPEFVAKSKESTIEKLQRKYSNAEAQNAFTDGYPIPRIGDLVRVRLTCSYLDGVEFLAGKLMDLASATGVKAVHEKQGKIEGYYAQHVNITQDVLLKVAGIPKAIQIECEIQIATDMSTKMWDTSHGLYERTRGQPIEAENWQWKHSDPRFISNQLGHLVHLVDGLLIQLRETTKNRK
jgi:ppGpp synthetase/RelA/SpoT-type nucleotidyltranferase